MSSDDKSQISVEWCAWDWFLREKSKAYPTQAEAEAEADRLEGLGYRRPAICRREVKAWETVVVAGPGEGYLNEAAAQQERQL